MTRISRRRFLAGSASIGTALLLSHNRVLGANDDIRVAIVGVGGKGSDHLNVFSKMPGVRVVALCDADQRVVDGAVDRLGKAGQKAQGYLDCRKVLDDKNVDAIVTATPNHWHSLMVVWSCQAGKDIYVEKPISHEIWEGRKAVEATKKYNRIVFAGTQRRSDVGQHELVNFLRTGAIGKILYARGFCYKRRGDIGKVSGPTPIPAGVDYNLWCGPAPMDPLMRKNLHYDWHWVWPTGNGDIGNQGIHEMDLCRWALGEPALAPRVYSFGGRFVYDDDATTPNTLVSVFDYPRAPLIFEVRGLPMKSGTETMDHYKGVRIGIVVQCEGGYFAGGGNGGWVYDNKGEKIRQFVQQTSGEHQANFIKAVRSRKQEDVTAPILEGHLSSALCHMGNISYRLGRNRSAGELNELYKGSKEALDSAERLKSHLADNGCDLGKTPIVVGPALTMDPAKEQFTGTLADEANRLATREYRKPFVVPENV